MQSRLAALLLPLMLTAAATGQSASPVVGIDTADLAATDGLNRTLPTFADVGPPKPRRWVGLFFWQWHGNLRHVPGQWDMTEFLRSHPRFRAFAADPKGGPKNPTYYWGEPIFGYYRSDDPWVIRKQIALIADAGVDFLFLDYTNGYVYDAQLKAFLDVARDMQAHGARVPRLTFFLNHEPEWKAVSLYEKWYKPGKYDDLWFRWGGKPLLMSAPPADGAKLRPGQNPAALPAVRRYFTFRKTWALEVADRDPHVWRFVAGLDAKPAVGPDGEVEQLVVAKSTGGPIWQSFAEGGVSAVKGSKHAEADYDAGWNLPDRAEGKFFAAGWAHAREVGAPILLVTGWNEWNASVWDNPGVPMLGRPSKKGEGILVDEFNETFNRDLEPQRGGTADAYYYQFVAEMRRYKGMLPPQRISPRKTVAVDGQFADWRGVTPIYRDTPADVAQRDIDGNPTGTHYENHSARNDFATAQVARDGASVYFHATTVGPLSPPAGERWMMLLIDADANPKTGWNGFDLLVNRTRDGGKCSVETNVGGKWAWKQSADASFASAGREVELALPRTLFGGGALRFNFKWLDNVPANPTVDNFYTEGDAAPDGRFTFTYSE